MNGQKLEIVETLTYLGCFIETRKKRVEQAHKALFSIYKLIQNECIPIDVQLKMFDSMVEPILLYGSEVWVFEDMYLIEQFHLKFSKIILNMRNTTANCMVYGDLGRFPLELRAKLRMISSWARLVQNEDKRSNMLYCFLFCLHSKGNHSFKWIEYIKKTWNELGMSYTYTNQFSFFLMLKVSNLLYNINIFKSGSVTFLDHHVVNFILFSRNLLALKTIYADCLSLA